MHKLKTFWHIFKHSLVPLDYYYHKLRSTHFSFSFKYFVSLFFIVVFFATIVKGALFVSMYPPQTLRTMITDIEEEYPDNLVITINDMGRLSTNAEKPYIVFSPLTKNPQPLVVIDPKAEPRKIYEYESSALLTERKMVIRAQDNIYEFNYQLDEPLKINQADVISISHNAQALLDSYWVFIASVVIAAMIVAPPLLIIANLLTLLISAFVVFVVVKLTVKRKTFTYPKVFQISLHTITGPLVIQSLMFVFALESSIPYWYMLLIYLFLAGGIYEAYFDKKK